MPPSHGWTKSHCHSCESSEIVWMSDQCWLHRAWRKWRTAQFLISRAKRRLELATQPLRDVPGQVIATEMKLHTAELPILHRHIPGMRIVGEVQHFQIRQSRRPYRQTSSNFSIPHHPHFLKSRDISQTRRAEVRHQAPGDFQHSQLRKLAELRRQPRVVIRRSKNQNL